MNKIEYNAKHVETEENIIISKICSITKEEYVLVVDKTDYFKWYDGEYIQDAFPDLKADDREFIKTGITPAEWEWMFPEEEEDRDLPF